MMFFKKLFHRMNQPIRPSRIVPGAQAPVLCVKNHNEGIIDLAKLYKGHTVFLYFYPKAGTPRCKCQAESIRDFYEAICARGVEVVGVSTDTASSLRFCRERTQLPFLLITDQEGELARAFEVPMRFGFATRCGFIIQSGKIIWRSNNLPVEGLGPELLEALEQLGIGEES